MTRCLLYSASAKNLCIFDQFVRFEPNLLLKTELVLRKFEFFFKIYMHLKKTQCVFVSFNEIIEVCN